MVSEGTDSQKVVKVGEWWGPERPELAFRKRLPEVGTQEPWSGSPGPSPPWFWVEEPLL